jgi:NAD(P)-dependent dehydrogenase (short-subunit alcohol dehydrogenase family)
MLKGMTVVIVGGAGLLGSEFCAAVAGSGGKVVIADRHLEAATKVAHRICEMYPGSAEAIAIDITDPLSVRKVVDHLPLRYGRIDAMVNNAYPRNSNWGRKLEDVTYGDFCENVGMHLGGCFLAAKEFALMFKRQGGGVIVNIGSIYGVMAPRFEVYDGTNMTMPVEYAAIKSAVVHLTRYFAQYFKGDGVRVNCLSPGGIEGSQPETFRAAYNAHCAVKGMLEPRDLVGAVLFLLSDQSKFMNGQNLVVDDGFSL